MLEGHRKNLLTIIRMSTSQVEAEEVVEVVAEAGAEDGAGGVGLECLGVCNTHNNKANRLIN
jgi:hypothetical protein